MGEWFPRVDSDSLLQPLAALGGAGPGPSHRWDAPTTSTAPASPPTGRWICSGASAARSSPPTRSWPRRSRTTGTCWWPSTRRWRPTTSTSAPSSSGSSPPSETSRYRTRAWSWSESATAWAWWEISISDRRSSTSRAPRRSFPSLREALIAAVNRIAVLLGEYPSQLHAELREPAPIPLPEAEVAVGLPANLLRQRPDLRSAERQLAAQSARIGVATADLYPRLALLGSFAFDSASPPPAGSPTEPRPGASGRSCAGTSSTGAASAATSAPRRRSRARHWCATSRPCCWRWRRSRTRWRAMRRSARAPRSCVEPSSRRSRPWSSSASSIRTGLVDFLNVLDSERSLFEQQDQLLDSEGRVAKNLVRVYRALGGGWTP